MGRPSIFTPELSRAICDRLSECESLRSICRDEGMPDRVTVFRWLAADEEFRSQYALAREIQAENMVEEIIEISDDGTNDWMERQSTSEKGAGVNTGWVLNGEHVQRSRLRVDSRKWVAANLAPKKFGNKVATEITGANGGALEVITEIRRTIVDPKS